MSISVGDAEGTTHRGICRPRVCGCSRGQGRGDDEGGLQDGGFRGWGREEGRSWERAPAAVTWGDSDELH